jgi:pimeloyl-ACP methyl ester carboxylesterase
MDLVELGGRRLAVWDRGQGTPLVFIHGVGTSGELWADDLDELASDCRLIVYDRRGYGASSESPRDWKAHRDDVEALIEALDARPAVIAGYSGGAIVALDLVVNRPDLVSRLVLLDPAFDIKRCVTPGLVRAMATARLLRRVRGDRSGAERWMRYVGSYPSGGSAFERTTAERREKLLANAGAVFADSDSGYGDHVPRERVREIAAPTTIVECRLSPPFLRKSCERLRALMPQAETITLERSGHHIGVDAREELLAILRNAVAPGATASVEGAAS